MTISELRHQFNMAKKRNLSLKEWFVSQDDYDDLLEELRELCTTRTYIQEKPTPGMRILGVEIKVQS